MRFDDYKSNEGSKGGPLIYNDSVRDVLRTIASYDDGGLCKECHYFDENGLEIKKEDFLAHFLPRGANGELDRPLYVSFHVIIDQSNDPQTLLVRPNLGTQDRGRRLIESLPFGKKALRLLGVKNRNI